MKTTSNTTQNRAWTLVVVLTLVTLVAVAVPNASAVTVADLAGTWQATLFSNASCGVGTQVLVFSLNSSGIATDVQYNYHTSACGTGTDTNQSFTITSLNPDGSGTAQLVIEGTTTTYNIQANQGGTVFNMADITDKNQYHQGTALRQ
jgi:hypothetical protein